MGVLPEHQNIVFQNQELERNVHNSKQSELTIRL